MKDLIDREMAIKEIENKFAEVLTSHGYDSFEKADIFYQWYCNGLMDAIGILLDMEEEEPRWIPCSERLPEEDTDVLISYRYKEGEGDTSHAYIDITTYGQMYFGGRLVAGVKHWRPPFEYFTSNYEVIAWLPLPTPYEGEESDEAD